jgi:hypothetical protein
MTHEGRLIAGTGVWTGAALEASRRLSCAEDAAVRQRRHWRGLGRALTRPPAPRNRTSRAMSAVTSRIQRSAVLKATTRRGSSTRYTVPSRLSASGSIAARWANGTHARLRAGVAEAPLRGATPLVSSATLRRNASMRLTTLCGGAKVFLRSGMAPACLAFRCASSASS